MLKRVSPPAYAGTRIHIMVALATLVATATWSPMIATADNHVKPNASANLDNDAIADLERLSEAFASVSQAVKPSVVHIKALSINKALNRDLQKMLGDDTLRPVPTTGTGSGIIIDEDGHIVTNNHVVADARRVYVTLADGRKFTAKIVGTDPKTDLAVLKINADRLSPAKIGNSDAVRVGQIVLAIGSPFRLGHSVSHGIISAIGRSDESIDVEIAYKNWIQTDAPINPGNSGGPLINVHGEVIGINVAIATESGGHQGVGFAIPANTVSKISAVLKSGQKIVRGFLGVEIAAVDDKVADAYGLSDVGGVFIRRVGDESPAQKGGLKPEDIVLEVNGKPVMSYSDLQEVVATMKPGADIPLTVWRKGTRTRLNVTVGRQPEGFSTRGVLGQFHDDAPAAADKDDEETTDDDLTNGRFGDLGFDAETLTPSLAKKYKLDDSTQSGVLVTRVDLTSEAQESGLRARQIIIRANDKPIRNVGDLQEVLTKDAVAKGVRLKFRIGGEDDYLVLRIR